MYSITHDLAAATLLLVIVGGLQVLPYAVYYLLMKRESSKPWNVKVSDSYRPRVTIIVPTYNEVEAIEAKLRNLNELNYPEDLLEVIVVDSASTDGTLDKCREWLAQNNFKFKVTLLSESYRVSKSHALNYALKQARGEVIVISDADAMWEPDFLLKSLKYLADPDVAAVCGREVPVEVRGCLTSKLESSYRSIFPTLRLGESKLHSPQVVQGELAIKRSAIKSFVDEPGRSDDNGVATEILAQGKRCLYAAEAVFYTYMPCSMTDYLSVKVRRASQLQREFLVRLRLWTSGRLTTPAITLLANFYQHIVAPALFLALIPALIHFLTALYLHSPSAFYAFLSLATLLSYLVRYTAMSYLVSNVALVLAMFSLLIGKKTRGWKPVRSSRKYLGTHRSWIR